jgi:dTDP-4-amino-4,6-dideoxygalactose transaminase
MSDRKIKVDYPKWPIYEDDEIKVVTQVLRSGKVNMWGGEHVEKFEKEFSKYVGMPHGLTVSNGTIALELALKAFGIGPGDEVIVPSKSFIATASSVVTCGATPVFADVDINSHNICINSIKQKATSNTAAIIVVHLGGNPCEMNEIIDFANDNNLVLIEDCAQAHGAEYKNKKVGSFGDASAFSFCQDKIISTGGEGGMLLFKDYDKWKKSWEYRDHGKDYDVMKESSHSDGYPWPHVSVGSNLRMTEIQAAIGRKQLNKLESWIQKRRQNAEVLIEKLSKRENLSFTKISNHINPVYYRVYGILDLDKLKPNWNKQKVINEINNLGVPCFHGSCNELYKEKAFSNLNVESMEHAKNLNDTSICFLCHHTLNQPDIESMAEIINSVLNKASI